MIKFDIITSQEYCDNVQNKKVCDVVEYHCNSSYFGEYHAWKGSIEEKYFMITFSRGFLILTFHERDIDIINHKQISIPYAISSSLVKYFALEEKVVIDGQNYLSLITPEILEKYKTEEKEEQKNVSFENDIMSIFKWSKSEKFIFHKDLLMN